MPEDEIEEEQEEIQVEEEIAGDLPDSTTETDLLRFLLTKGMTPSFSFPLDVCRFVAQGTLKWKLKTWASTNQDLRVALAEYAPGKILTINKVDYEIGGLFFPMAPNQVNRASHVLGNGMDSPALEYYNRCNNDGCGWIWNYTDQEIPNRTCPVCESEGNPDGESVETKRFLRPEGFAPIMVPYGPDDEPFRNLNPVTSGMSYTMKADRPGRNRESTVGGKVEMPAPLLASEEEGRMQEKPVTATGYCDRLTLHGSSTDHCGELGIELIVVNGGYGATGGGVGRGYYICPHCGRTDIRTPAPLTVPHSRPYGISLPKDHPQDADARALCNTPPLDEPILLGAKFRSDLITIRLRMEDILGQSRVVMRRREFNGALLAIKEALITEIQDELKFINREIGGGIRKIREEVDGQFSAEIFLFDAVSGGAGLVTQVFNEADERLATILEKVEVRLSGIKCTSGIPCDRACVGCLLDYRNNREHNVLDRVHGRMLLKYLRDGQAPVSDFESDEDEKSGDPTGFEELRASMQVLAATGIEVELEQHDGYSFFIFRSEIGTHIIRPISPFTSPTSDPVVAGLLDDPDDWEEFELGDDLDEDTEYWYYIFPQMKRNISTIMSRINNALRAEFDY
uniref:Helicase n=1 Tax=uncultured marine group II/III euryarchaeote KM3_74_A11 TaxID=1456500 RepID=A0A075HJ05_9EURY|nr:helicase [uncultured marine group II/III euryarchaeote KM3_74_A11]